MTPSSFPIVWLQVAIMICVLMTTSTLAQFAKPKTQEASTAEKPGTDELPDLQLHEVWRDDFSKDTRKMYQIEGDVSWEQGKFTLSAGAAITRKINCGSWVKMDLKLSTIKPGQTAELRVWFVFDRALPCYVSLRRFIETPDRLTVAIVNFIQQNGKPVDFLVREVVLHVNDDVLQIEYRNGLVKVSANREGQFLAFVENGKPQVTAVGIHALAHERSLLECTSLATNQQPAFSVEEQFALTKATEANSEFARLVQDERFAEACKIGEAVLVVRRTILGKMHPDYATSLFNLASICRLMGDNSRAKSLYLEARAIREQALGKEHPDYASSLNSLATLYDSMGEFSRAEPLYLEAQAIFERVFGKEHPDYVINLGMLALNYQSIGDFAHAQPLYEQAHPIMERVLGKGHPAYSSTLNNLATLYTLMGDYSRAENLYIEALAIRERNFGKKHPAYATTLDGLAVLYDSMGDYARAEPLYLEANAVWRITVGEEHPDYAINLSGLAYLYASTGEHARAEPLFLEAKAIQEKVLGKNNPDYATTLNNMALHYKSMGDYSRAEDLLLESRAIRERVLGKEHPSYAISLNNLALLYESMTEYALAEPLCLEAKEIRERVLGKEHPDYATNINNLASIYKSMGDNARAESLYLEANAIDEKVLGKEHPYYATSLSNLALHYESMGDTARAESLLLESKAIREKVLGKSHPDYAMSLNNLATLYSLSNRTNLAIPLYENSLSLWRTHLTATAAVLSERQQLAMNQSLRGYLDSYITACLRMNPTPPDAVSKIMLWKGSVLHRQRQMRKAAEDSAIAGQFARLQVAVRRLSQLAQAPPASEKLENWKQQIRELTAEKETLESELSRESAVFRDAMQEISFEQIQQAIPADGVLVDYLEYTGKKGRSLLASIVRPNAAPVMINLGSANEASEAIDAWRDTFGMSLQGKAAGLQLRKQIWEPLLEHIGDARTVLVSTDGVLGRLPLAALPGKEPGTYLLEDHRLALIPVSQLLPAMVNELGKQQLQREITRTGEAGKSLLLVGDVDYGTASTPQTQGTVTWGALGQTGAEVDYIGGLYQRLYSPRADAVVDLRNLAATETAFRNEAPNCVYLHLATHGFFAAADKKSALSSEMIALAERNRSGLMGQNRDAVVGLSPGQLSGLVFAGANRRRDATQIAGDADDGILTADEIAFLPLENVQLAVLSACETGLGEVAGGEGLLGIQRGFQIAGAKSVVASLWKVDDAATRRFMQEFYTNLLEKKMSTLDALREAQLWALKHPADVAFAVRGPLVSRPDAEVVDAPEVQADARLSPRYWAPFVLSGDWR